MSERDEILTALVAEVLGPRSGPFEILPADQNPRDEFITGVLAPARAPQSSDDIDADVDELIEEESSEEDQDSDGGVVIVPSGFAPALDPKSLPRSLGVSFTVGSDEARPLIEICATWARYREHEQGWQRDPDCFLTGVVPADQDASWQAANGVSLQMRTRPLAQGCRRVSLFLVNVTPIPDNQRVTTEHHLFQPQIRVHCGVATSLVPVMTHDTGVPGQMAPDSLETEDVSLALLYRDRAAFARGHMCGATWREIDPERPHPVLTAPRAAPFAWTDAALVPATERAKFTPADVRTELVPCYPIETPEMEWDGEYGPPPALDPDQLAEVWSPDDIRQCLLPLVDGYRTWIVRQRTAVQGLSQALSTAERRIAAANLQLCEQAADRIQEAIGVLVDDPDARLAFCFANKAIATQARWRGRPITWRPFQLAFLLVNLPALAVPTHADRRTCDLLWFPTGGGKTEAYLGLAAFALALRRRRASSGRIPGGTGAGVGVLSRYTLRLLTIQQFRRALGLITACELLRVHNLDVSASPIGWRPQACTDTETFLWGGQRFSAGLWVGGNVTPNGLHSMGPIPGPTGAGLTFYAGALDILQGASAKRDYVGPDQRLQRNLQSAHVEADGEPAQVLSCPCCHSTLAIPDEGLAAGRQRLHFIYTGGSTAAPLSPAGLVSNGAPFTVEAATVTVHRAASFQTLSITLTIARDQALTPRGVDEWWYQTLAPALGPDARLLAARPARPGYFILSFRNSKGRSIPCDFDIFCPNPACELNQHAWAEQVPLSRTTESVAEGHASRGQQATAHTGALPTSSRPVMQWQEVPAWGRRESTLWVSNYIPIPACTVDDQVYHRCPTLIIGTVDKFARLAYEPKAASLFGNVEYYHSRWGYYRWGCPPATGILPTTFQDHPSGFATGNPLHVAVPPFAPPDLILQDELHLIEGPLGSMVGLYETAIDELCTNRTDNHHTIRAKYVASTATVRQAESQVQALFDRTLAQFPPSAISADDRFFARPPSASVPETHPLDCARPGRLYVGICAPGKGAQTPIVRIWSSLLQRVYDRWQVSPSSELNRFYTLIGYFNAIRELAGALSLFRQDIVQRIDFRAPGNARPLDLWLELSSRKSSLDLPALLDRLEVNAPAAVDAVFATSMFGTGVDVDRLGLMVVHGQPKTTSSYIQATGRVGRQGGGLVVTFFRASRPRDLDHYEFFTGYHRALYRHIEPITVAPFSPRARERALGPLAVVLLRHARALRGAVVNREWRVQQRLSGAYFSQALRMGPERYDPEILAVPGLLADRAQTQPAGRRPIPDTVRQEVASELDRWSQLAKLYPDRNRFVYSEPALLKQPERIVVLGDAQHRAQGLDRAYENAPQSLREVEETTSFQS